MKSSEYSAFFRRVRTREEFESYYRVVRRALIRETINLESAQQRLRAMLADLLTPENLKEPGKREAE